MISVWTQALTLEKSQFSGHFSHDIQDFQDQINNYLVQTAPNSIRETEPEQSISDQICANVAALNVIIVLAQTNMIP